MLRFNGRVLFVKDVLGDEICCWSFYGEGRKIAEVCCTSIVYATEKKQTKVRVTRCVHRVLKYWFDKAVESSLTQQSDSLAKHKDGKWRELVCLSKLTSAGEHPKLTHIWDILLFFFFVELKQDTWRMHMRSV